MKCPPDVRVNVYPTIGRVLTHPLIVVKPFYFTVNFTLTPLIFAM